MAVSQYRDRNWFAPWKEFDQASRHLDCIFSDSGLEDQGAKWLPSVNVEKMQDELVLIAEFPGLKKEDIEIEVDNNVLRIQA